LPQLIHRGFCNAGEISLISATIAAGTAQALPIAMDPKDLQERTFQFALSAYDFAKPMLRAIETQHISQQLIRASSSVAANHRAAGLARSRREFTAKIGIVGEEADESAFWVLFIHRAGLASGTASDRLLLESHELAAIFRAAYRTCRRRPREEDDPLSP